jgi:hypothetical protein
MHAARSLRRRHESRRLHRRPRGRNGLARRRPDVRSRPVLRVDRHSPHRSRHLRGCGSTGHAGVPEAMEHRFLQFSPAGRLPGSHRGRNGCRGDCSTTSAGIRKGHLALWRWHPVPQSSRRGSRRHGRARREPAASGPPRRRDASPLARTTGPRASRADSTRRPPERAARVGVRRSQRRRGSAIGPGREAACPLPACRRNSTRSSGPI